MATFDFAGLVLKENHLSNSSAFNRTTMTNSSLTSLSSVQIVSHKRKRPSLPDILCTTAGRAKSFLKRFSSSFTTSSDKVSLSPNQSGCPVSAQSPSLERDEDEIRLSMPEEKLFFREKVDLNKLGKYDVLEGATYTASRSPKAVCVDSMSPTRWSRLEISISPKKCEHTSNGRLLPQHRGDVRKCLPHCDIKSSPHLHASRVLCWEQASKEESNNEDIMPTWSSAVSSDEMIVEKQIHYINELRHVTASGNNACVPMYINGVTNTLTRAPLKADLEYKDSLRHHLQTESSLTIASYEPSPVPYENLLANETEPLPLKDVDIRAKVCMKTVHDLGISNDNIDTESEIMVQPVASDSATKTAQVQCKDGMEVESDDSKVTENSTFDIELKLVKTKITKSLLFLPFPNIPFKIRTIQPPGARFEVSYLESSMIPHVRTAGEVFEATLQEIIIDGAGQQRYRNSASHFYCTIRVVSSDSTAKFEEIKEALRKVSDTYNIGIQGFMETMAKISDKRMEHDHVAEAAQVSINNYRRLHPSGYSGATCAADMCEVSREQYNLQASSVDRGCKSSDIESTSNEQVTASNNQVSLPKETMSNEKKSEAFSNEKLDRLMDSREVVPNKIVSPLRRSCRKIKTASLWKERNAYARRVTRPASPDPMGERHNNVTCPANFSSDRKYLDKKMIVNQFIQDITGVPVVVLERLSDQELQKKIKGVNS